MNEAAKAGYVDGLRAIIPRKGASHPGIKPAKYFANAPDSRGATPLINAILYSGKAAEVIPTLVSLEANVNLHGKEDLVGPQNKKIASRTPLCLAVELGDLPAIKALSEAGQFTSFYTFFGGF